MMCNSVFSLARNFFSYKVVGQNKTDTFDLWGLSILFALQSTTFSTAHFILAWTYRGMAKDMPRQLDEIEVDEDEQKHDEKKYKVLLALNIGIPLL